MQLSENGARILKNFEGVRLAAYVCSAGKWTIGVGHTGLVDGKSIVRGMTITKEKCEELFKQDIKVFENYVNATKLKLNQNQFDALVSFTFNLGKGCLQTLIKNRTLWQIADAILLYNKAAGKVVQGLITRRKKERELFLTSTAEEVGKQVINNEKKLPYEVKTICDLNIRTAAGTNYPIIRTVKKGTKLKVWAVCTSGGLLWGKNGQEWYCLKYCEVI